MKKIIFVRHAKSSWEHKVSDRNRPLKPRGVNDATLVSTALMTKRLIIDKVYSSPANRALSTCNIFVEQLNISPSIVSIKEELYDFEGESVIDFIKSIDDALHTVMLFGHNYAFTSIINAYGDRHIDNLPTSGLAMISFEIESWKYIKFGHTETILLPRDFKF